MPTMMSTTWRDAPVQPDRYDDLAQLLFLARRARNRMVEFDWGFSEDELRRLRAAAHYWGSPTVGRYKAFDARVIAAVNHRGMLCGEYSVLDPQTLHAGSPTLVWNAGGTENWPATLPGFMDRLPEMAGRITQMIQTVRVHVAALDDDQHLFSRLEGAVGRHFARHSDGQVRRYFGAGIKLPATIPGERVLSIRVGSEVGIAGLGEAIAG